MKQKTEKKYLMNRSEYVISCKLGKQNIHLILRTFFMFLFDKKKMEKGKNNFKLLMNIFDRRQRKMEKKFKLIILLLPLCCR